MNISPWPSDWVYIESKILLDSNHSHTQSSSWLLFCSSNNNHVPTVITYIDYQMRVILHKWIRVHRWLINTVVDVCIYYSSPLRFSLWQRRLDLIAHNFLAMLVNNSLCVKISPPVCLFQSLRGDSSLWESSGSGHNKIQIQCLMNITVKLSLIKAIIHP